MPVAELKNAEVAADGVERFRRRDVRRRQRAWWHRTRLSPSFEDSVNYQRPTTNVSVERVSPTLTDTFH
jgi:hypothetical protein